MVLNFKNQTYVLDKSLPRTLSKRFLPEECLTFESLLSGMRTTEKYTASYWLDCNEIQ
ncbi:UNVERIFIED_CONTAM: hypothetical protein Sangu_1710900 [Sesamum angustifolium]|uniref:Uncharacterized protein n=1 Tax=Sesamum angustifolium TaxID=2727405 RepID=A0AAW2MJB1_9LAMI